MRELLGVQIHEIGDAVFYVPRNGSPLRIARAVVDGVSVHQIKRGTDTAIDTWVTYRLRFVSRSGAHLHCSDEISGKQVMREEDARRHAETMFKAALDDIFSIDAITEEEELCQIP